MQAFARAFLVGAAAALLLALAAPLPAQAAPPPDGVGRLLPPDRRFGGLSGADVTGEGWVSTLSTPGDELEPRCLRLGRGGAVLLALQTDTAPTCRVGRRTAIYVLGLTQFCSSPRADRVPPAQERRCARDGIRETVGNTPIAFTVDGRRVADLNADRYLTCSPQRRTQVPPGGNVFGDPPGPITVTGCGYVGWLVDLPPGTHVLRSVTGDVYEWSATVVVAPR